MSVIGSAIQTFAAYTSHSVSGRANTNSISRSAEDTVAQIGGDELLLSPAAKEMLSRLPFAEKELQSESSASDDKESKLPNESSTESTEGGETSNGELTEEEQELVKKLAARDREVRTHEQAHLAAAGQYARGGPTYTYQKGPDARNYAVGGEVQIDTSPVSGDAEATIRKARIVRAAALAPAEPSAQDRVVAAAATKMEMQARAEKSQQSLQSSEDKDSAPNGTVTVERRPRSLNLLA